MRSLQRQLAYTAGIADINDVGESERSLPVSVASLIRPNGSYKVPRVSLGSIRILLDRYLLYLQRSICCVTSVYGGCETTKNQVFRVACILEHVGATSCYICSGDHSAGNVTAR